MPSHDSTIQSKRATVKPRLFFTWQGRTLCMKDWAKESGIPRKALQKRLRQLGWNIERALTTPLRSERRTTPETKRLYMKAWRETHVLQRQATKKAWALLHAEEEREKSLAYARDHPEVSRAAAKRRRARKKNAPISDFTAGQWIAMQEHYSHRCLYCGKRAKGKLTQDHITPLFRGGSHTIANIVPACRDCNAKKHIGAPPCPIQPLLLL